MHIKFVCFFQEYIGLVGEILFFVSTVNCGKSLLSYITTRIKHTWENN